MVSTRVLQDDKTIYLQLVEETDTMLREDVLDVWFPRCVDRERGGFHSAFTRKWEPDTSEGKFSVFQARLVWVAAQAAMRYPGLRAEYLPVLAHGLQFLRNVLWDNEFGGFYWGVGDQNQRSDFYTDGKHLYGVSFCTYALAGAYEASKDPRTLELAQESFCWAEKHAYDEEHGGYREWMSREGKAFAGDRNSAKVADVPVAAFPAGYKSMNTHIHMLEAYTELHRAWPDPLLRKRLEELLAIVRDRIAVEPGTLNLYFTEDWKPIPQNDSYGHDLETTYLMLEAEDSLGIAHSPATERMSRLLVDHALAYGWDEEFGGFYQSGPAVGLPEDRRKEWWVQFEGLNALLLMHQKYGAQTRKYFDAFGQQWRFIREYLCDHEYRGVYEMLGEDARPISTKKGRIWKCCYHETRTLLNVGERLRALAAALE